jgi:tetratricopeptide (TPR) repeat protein
VGGEYQFIHALIQQTLYNNLSVGQRQHLHGAIAQLLESLYGENASLYAADLAIHFERGGDMTKAIPYYLQAGRAALAIFALDDALLYAEKVRELATQVSDKEQATAWQLDALIQIAETRHWKAEYDTALAACEEGEALCQNNEFAEQHAYLLYWRSVIASATGKIGNTVEPVRQALTILNGMKTEPRLLGILYAQLGRLNHSLPLDEIQQALDKSLTIAQQHNFPDIKATVLIYKTRILNLWTYEYEDAAQAAIEALEIAERYKMPHEKSVAHGMIGQTYFYLKRNKDSLYHCEQAVLIARKYGLIREQQNALRRLTLVLRDVKEDWEGALDLLYEASRISNQHNFPIDRDLLGVWITTTMGLGHWQESIRLQELHRERIEEDHSYPRSWGFFYQRKGKLEYARGAFVQAVKSFEHAIEVFDFYSPGERDTMSTRPFLGLALFACNEEQKAFEHLEKSYIYWKGRKRPIVFAQSIRGLAQIDMAAGIHQKAIDRLREAFSAVEGFPESMFGWPVWQHVCVDLGRALLATGETEEALQHAMFGYQKFKKWGHFLLGEAAFVVGQILVAQGKRDEALTYLHEARSDWQRLELTHHLPDWEAFMQEHGLETASG